MSPANKTLSFKILTSAAFLSSALLAFPTMAQQQPAPAANTAASSDAAQGAAPQTGEQQPAPQARVQKFDDWYYRCIDGKAADGSAATSCEVAQIATVKQGDQDVNILTLAVAKAPSAPPSTSPKGGKQLANELILTTLVPLNMYLPAGIGIDASDKPVVQLAYRNCNQAGCWAQQKLDTKMVAALAKATDGIGHVQMMNGQKVNIKFSLKGLAAALEALQKPASK